MEDALKKELSKEDILNSLEAQINQALYDLENEFLPQLGHSETKRLLMAEKKYPMINTDFSGESNAMKQAFSACKVINDAQVALGVEVVIEQMVKTVHGQQQEELSQSEEVGND